MKYLLLALTLFLFSCDDSDFRDSFSYFEDSNYNYEFRIDGYFIKQYKGPFDNESIGIIYLFENGLYYQNNLYKEDWKKNESGCYELSENDFNGEWNWGTFQVENSNLINMEIVSPKNRDVNSSPFLILEGKYLISKETYDHFGFGNMTPQEIQEEAPIHIYEFFPCTDKPDSSRSHIYRHFND